MSIPLTEIERINALLPTELFAGSKDWRVGSIADRVDWLLTMYSSAKEEVERLQSALEVQPQQEPVAEDNSNYRLDPPGLDPRYTSPPAQRKPLTDEWQPSETGPQDGTPCLVYWGQSFGVPLIGVARRIYPYKGEMLWHGHGGSHNEVTHWMPLPDAPIEAVHGIKENT